MSRIRPLLYLSVAAVMMVGAACGGSSSSGSSGGGNSTPAFSPTTPSTSSGGGVVGGSDFCAKGKADVQQLQTKLAGIAGAAGTADGLKSEMQTLQDAYKNALDEAPSEIKPDLQTIYDFVNTINTALSAKNYDPTALVGIVGQIQSQQAKLKAAANHIETWAKTNCGA